VNLAKQLKGTTTVTFWLQGQVKQETAQKALLGDWFHIGMLFIMKEIYFIHIFTKIQSFSFEFQYATR
jgi:hypothetical protein